MSFSADVKEELADCIGKSRHCQIAQLAGLFAFCGHVSSRDGKSFFNIKSENLPVIKAAEQLIGTAFGKDAVSFAGEDCSSKGKVYIVQCDKEAETIRILKALKFVDETVKINSNTILVNNMVIQKNCCKRAFIRGAFLAAGSISDPEKFYHFEIVCQTIDKARQMAEILNCFNLGAKLVERKSHYVVYLKEGDKIVDALNIMEAYVSLMRLENIRILKEMRNNVNRQVNCETANINKTVSAAVKQREDIEYLKNNIGLEALPEQLREIAVLRLENSDASLKELGLLLTSPVGKSGVNHRLRKISTLAEELRNKKEDYFND